MNDPKEVNTAKVIARITLAFIFVVVVIIIVIRDTNNILMMMIIVVRLRFK